MIPSKTRIWIAKKIMKLKYHTFSLKAEQIRVTKYCQHSTACKTVCYLIEMFCLGFGCLWIFIMCVRVDIFFSACLKTTKDTHNNGLTLFSSFHFFYVVLSLHGKNWTLWIASIVCCDAAISLHYTHNNTKNIFIHQTLSVHCLECGSRTQAQTRHTRSVWRSCTRTQT